VVLFCRDYSTLDSSISIKAWNFDGLTNGFNEASSNGRAIFLVFHRTVSGIERSISRETYPKALESVVFGLVDRGARQTKSFANLCHWSMIVLSGLIFGVTQSPIAKDSFSIATA